MKASLRYFLILICLELAVIPLSAHHATATNFDVSKTRTVKGVISTLSWANPHVHALLDVRVGNGSEQQWDVELGSPGAIIVSGLSKDLLKPGTTLTITGYPAKENIGGASPRLAICATKLTLADGTIATFVVGI